MKLILMILFCVNISIESIPEYKETLVVVPKQTSDIIKQFEGIKLTAYKDTDGNFTIGVGHYDLTPPEVTPGMTITQQQADAILQNDLEHTLSLVQGHIAADLTDNQLAAVLSFAFNEGAHAFITSTLLKEINSGNFDNAAEEFLRWDISGGKVTAGLDNRRAAERKLFLTPDTVGETDVASN